MLRAIDGQSYMTVIIAILKLICTVNKSLCRKTKSHSYRFLLYQYEDRIIYNILVGKADVQGYYLSDLMHILRV